MPDETSPNITHAIRYDRAPVDAAFEVTPEGYVRTMGRIAKPGIMVYRDASGKVTRELVPQSTLEDPEFLSSLENKPLTVEHPPVMLTPENIGEYRKGMVLAPCRFGGGYVQAPIQVDDAAAIAAMRSGKVELSPGYEVDIDGTPGVDPVFGQYDAVQTKRYGGNHTALCDKARGGADIRLLRTDSAVEVAPESAADPASPPLPTEPPVYKMSDTLGAAMKAHGVSDADIAACKSDEDAHSMLMGAAKKDEPKVDEVAPELAAKQAEIVKLSADLAKAQSDLAVMVEQHELVSGDMAAKVDDLMEDPDMEAGMDAAMKMDSARKDAVKSARRRNFDAIRATAIARTDLEAFAETVGILRTDSAKLGNAALTKRVALKVSPKLASDKTAAYYSAALDMARHTRIDRADSASFWKRTGEENSKPDSETSYVRTI